MKMYHMLLGILLGASVNAAVQLPDQPCRGRDCSAPMHDMVEKFFESVPVGDDGLPGLWSGGCYHAGSLYDSKTEHHGVVYLVRNDLGQVFFNGRFSFFFEKNPYADWTLQDAERQYPEPFKKVLVKENGNSVAD